MVSEKISNILFFFFCCTISFGQNIEGHVLDKISLTPLVGASVYFDGTTIGTITDDKGFFSIPFDQQRSSPLVVSYLGYVSKIISTPTDLKNKEILLKPIDISLNEVILVADPWSRAKKLREFKKVFLGRTIAAQDCKILNENAIKLRYDPETKTLEASADETILVENKHLGYLVQFHLSDFQAIYHTPPSGFTFQKLTYYAGTSFFSESREKPKRRHRKERKRSYLGSPLHFMRSLSNKELKENDFRIFFESKEISPYQYLEITPEGKFTRVALKTEKLSVLYDGILQSSIHKTDSEYIYIDSFGNYSPASGIMFGGDFGNQGIAHMLPLDYRLQN